MSIDFLHYLHNNQVISEGEYYRAKAEQEVEIEFSPSEVIASQDGPISVLSYNNSSERGQWVKSVWQRMLLSKEKSH